MEDRKPFSASYSVYKTQAAMSLKLIEAKVNEKGSAYEAGGFMIEMASSLPNEQRKYDWSNSARFFISANEAMKFCKLIKVADKDSSIYHDPDKGSANEGTRAKTLSAEVYEGKKFLKLYMPSQKKSFRISLDESEEDTMITLIRESLTKVYGW